ncbi:MmgE/PrpD family protein [Desulfobacula sp.]|uniref:MmgE/PrpD family protein n=1 Tax=Desulfobacula sp. TaxID=2593537 RepID=UPI00263246E2|nr:MmgE/PrpD family protein [Desulfobacula sp.]
MVANKISEKTLPVSDHLITFCQFIVKTDLKDIPPHVIDHARLVLIDTIGVIIAGAGNKEIKKIAKRMAASGPLGQGATCPGRSESFDPFHAALINGMAGSTSEYEEGHSKAMGHPAIQIVPAMLADCESKDLSGDLLLKGFIIGYEVACRISRASSIRKGLHPTGSWGVIGSALGVGSLHQKDPESLCQIANIASSYAISSYVKNSFVGQNVSCTFAGLANLTGLIANLFFETGIRADSDSLKMTFSRFVSDEFKPGILDEALGKKYEITENYFKPYPTCRFTHPALEALKTIIQNIKIDPKEVSHIEVISFKAAVHAGSGAPANLEALRFSIPYLIAVMLIRGEINSNTLTEDLVQMAEIAELAEKVKMVYSSDYEQLRPEKYPARVTLTLFDGRQLSHEIMDCLGDTLNPLSRQEIHNKFISLASPVVGQSKSELFLEKLVDLENQKHVRPIINILRVNKI